MFIESVYSPELSLRMWRRLVRHESGHLFGLDSREFSCEDNLRRYCTNICTLRQGVSLVVWKELTGEEDAKGIDFCEDCATELPG